MSCSRKMQEIYFGVEVLEHSGCLALKVKDRVIAYFRNWDADLYYMECGPDLTEWALSNGVLDKSTWPTVVRNGFDECNRVVKPNGVIVFKWNEEQIPFSKVLKAIGRNPLFGDKRGKTRWVVFKKASDENG